MWLCEGKEGGGRRPVTGGTSTERESVVDVEAFTFASFDLPLKLY
jgi:hypothetical protein